MTHAFGFRLSTNHVCVSTSGRRPTRCATLPSLPARLAWSVHAADEASGGCSCRRAAAFPWNCGTPSLTCWRSARTVGS